jgi:hypothetical protein
MSRSARTRSSSSIERFRLANQPIRPPMVTYVKARVSVPSRRTSLDWMCGLITTPLA